MSALSAEPRPATLERAFFERSSVVVARELLGVWLLRRIHGQLCGGPIVETEAYGGPEDRASHARAGLTRRTAPMFGPAGHAYVYLVYGMHHCVNVVAHADDPAGAVLIRAIEPRLGIEAMRKRRGRPSDPAARLCAGPARLCRALAVDRAFDGHDLTSREGLWLDAEAREQPPEIASGPRIGVSYAGEGWADRPWRFWIAGNRSVSR